jgi:hypothetical protein
VGRASAGAPVGPHRGGGAAARGEGCQPGQAAPGGATDSQVLAPALSTLCDTLGHAHYPSQRFVSLRPASLRPASHCRLSGWPLLPSARVPFPSPAPITLAHLVNKILPSTAVSRAQELKLCEFSCLALIPQALAQPSMPRLRSLEMFTQMGDCRSSESLTSVWAAPWFSQLQELSLTTDQGFGGLGLAPLRAAPLLRKLNIQTANGAPALTADDGCTLAAAALPELRDLQLWNVGPGLVSALAAAPWMLRLEWLSLKASRKGPACGLAAADGRALAAAQLPALKRLVISDAERGFMAACAAAAWLGGLERLHLGCMGGLLGRPAYAKAPRHGPQHPSRRSSL